MEKVVTRLALAKLAPGTGSIIEHPRTRSRERMSGALTGSRHRCAYGTSALKRRPPPSNACREYFRRPISMLFERRILKRWPSDQQKTAHTLLHLGSHLLFLETFPLSRQGRLACRFLPVCSMP